MADPLEELFGPVKTPEAAPPSPQAAGPDPLEQMFGPAKGVAPPPSASPPRPGLLANDPADSDRVDIAKNIGTVIEPVLIVLIAMVVLAVALAIFLPMWDMVKLVG